jgi:TadE-like protein
MVEFALAAPLFLMVLVGVIVLGIIVFYNQQLTNAAREAARFASVHSASAQGPVVSTLVPAGVDPNTGHTGAVAPPISYLAWDAPPTWPHMTAHARSKVFGLDPANAHFTACWSGYRTSTQYDTPPPGDYEIPAGSGTIVHIASTFAQCEIGGVDPTQSSGSIGCPGGATTDTASSSSEGQGRIVANRVTVYACYEWSPPMAGFLLIPDTVTFRAVISEPIERQQ